MATRREGRVCIYNGTGQRLLRVSVGHKYSDNYKNDHDWDGPIENGATTKETMDVQYNTGALTTGVDWWVVTWVTEDGITHITDPKNMRGFADALERVAVKVAAPTGTLAIALRAASKINPAFATALVAASLTTAMLTNSETTVGFKQHMLRKADELHFFNENVYRDTNQIAEGLKEMYGPWFQRKQLVLIPDASSKQRSTAAAQESDMGILRRAGHRVDAQQRNPLVADRINAVNMLIEQRKIRVGNRCKHLIRTFEQHAYDDKGKVEKGGVGMDDLSHAGDAAGYAIYRLAPITQWRSGARTKVGVPSIYARR